MLLGREVEACGTSLTHLTTDTFFRAVIPFHLVGQSVGHSLGTLSSLSLLGPVSILTGFPKAGLSLLLPGLASRLVTLSLPLELWYLLKHPLQPSTTVITFLLSFGGPTPAPVTEYWHWGHRHGS